MIKSYILYLTNNDEDKMKIGNEIVDHCIDIDADVNCEAAEKYGQCFREQAKAHNAEDYFYLMSYT